MNDGVAGKWRQGAFEQALGGVPVMSHAKGSNCLRTWGGGASVQLWETESQRSRMRNGAG